MFVCLMTFLSERLFVILDGIVVYEGGIGPWDYDVAGLEKWLQDYKHDKKNQ